MKERCWFEFNPLLVSLDTLSNFSFNNAEIKHISKPETRKMGQNLVLATYDIVINFNSELNYKFFPMDDHVITLVMKNNAVSPHEILFESDKRFLVLKTKIDDLGWKQFYHSIETGYVREDFNLMDKNMSIEHPAVQFSIFYARAGVKYTLILLLPMLVFIIVMLTAFSYDPGKYFSSIMVANGASLSGLIAYRFVIENMSPKVGYFMLSDILF